MERKAKTVGNHVNAQSAHLHYVAQQVEDFSNDTVAIAIGIDRTSVPMEENAPNKPFRVRKKPRLRKAPTPVTVQWRMDYVGTINYLDKNGDSLRIPA